MIASTSTWMGLVSESRWMMSNACFTMRTASSFLPLLRPCIISEAVSLCAGAGSAGKGAAEPPLCSAEHRRAARLVAGKAGPCRGGVCQAVPCIRSPPAHLSTMGHCALRKRFFWYRPAVCGTYTANLGFTAM